MSIDGVTWGDQLTLIAAAAMFQAEILIISSLENSACKAITPPSAWGVPLVRRLTLGHYHEYHYTSVVPAPGVPPPPPTREQIPLPPPIGSPQIYKSMPMWNYWQQPMYIEVNQNYYNTTLLSRSTPLNEKSIQVENNFPKNCRVHEERFGAIIFFISGATPVYGIYLHTGSFMLVTQSRKLLCVHLT